MSILVKVTFSRLLTPDEYNEAKEELTEYINAGHTENYFPLTADDNTSIREWNSVEIAQEVVSKLLAKPWCQSAEIIQT